MESREKIDDLLVITNRLITILERENEALRSHQFSDVSSLLEDKATISRIYETKLQGLEKNPDPFKNIEEKNKRELLELGEKANGLVEENGRLLSIAIDANKHVVELIAEAVRETSQKTETYGVSGSNKVSGSKAEAQAISISLDQTF